MLSTSQREPSAGRRCRRRIGSQTTTTTVKLAAKQRTSMSLALDAGGAEQIPEGMALVGAAVVGADHTDLAVALVAEVSEVLVRVHDVAEVLRELGSDVALDDFGRGLSSLTYLKTLPVTHLKIDGIFVRDVVTDDRSQAMLSAIVQLARAMKLKTVAECVESEAIWEATRALGVEYGQGFSIGRPTPLEKVLGALVGVTMEGSVATKTA